MVPEKMKVFIEMCLKDATFHDLQKSVRNSRKRHCIELMSSRAHECHFVIIKRFYNSAGPICLAWSFLN